MPVKIRLMRIGAKKRPFYRIVAVDERQKRTGKYLELLGTYNPLTEPKEIILKKDRIELWLKQGAVMSDGYLRMTKQAPQRPPRKPKKEKKDKAPAPTPEAVPEPTKEEPVSVGPESEESEGSKEPESQEDQSAVAKGSEAISNTEIAAVAPEGGPRNDENEPAIEEAKPDEEAKPEEETKE